MKPYLPLFIVLFLISHVVCTGPIDRTVQTVREVAECFHGDHQGSLKCVANVSSSLYNDLKEVAGHFMTTIEDHVHNWINSLQARTPPAH
ncbi:hypothetical protein KPH14_010436 [Odynerus spinipes]|uniref:Uncharacterized protein n=1 Tax=Odynerus spinipes TaxID=1348599 RepID=A0AAD9VTT6_9HYME|nr:hypothetical protein KPH14_010436 [Odynerus spinipes]